MAIVSLLPALTSLADDDIIFVVHSGKSYKMTVADFKKTFMNASNFNDLDIFQKQTIDGKEVFVGLNKTEMKEYLDIDDLENSTSDLDNRVTTLENSVSFTGDGELTTILG